MSAHREGADKGARQQSGGRAGTEISASGQFAGLALERVRWGGVLEDHLRDEVMLRGAERPLLVTSASLRRAAPEVDAAAGAIGAIDIFDRSRPHVPRDTVIDLLGAIRAGACDLIVTVGGGTAIDTVKVALAALANGVESEGDLDRLAIQAAPDGARRIPTLRAPSIRQIVVPTTLAGAEFSDLAGCTNIATRQKQLVTQAEIGAASVVMNAALTRHTPLALWLSTGVRAIDHAIETICSTASNPYADALAERGLSLLADALRRTMHGEEGVEPRHAAQMAVWMATAGLNRVPYGASHGIGHQLGAIAGVPHGLTSCVLLPTVLAFNESTNGDQQARVAAALGHPASPASEVIGALISDLGMPRRLRDVGVRPDQLPEIAASSLMNPFVRQNPRPLRTTDDVMQILQAAF